MNASSLLVAPLAALIALSACGRSTVDPPSLAYRPAEAIDPRLGVEHVRVTKSPTTALDSRLTELVADARQGEAAFREQLGPTRAAVTAAGSTRGERWVAAQQSLSALEAVRAPTTRAAAAIDAIAGETIAVQNDIGASDLAAIEAATTEADALARRQSKEIAELTARLAN